VKQLAGRESEPPSLWDGLFRRLRDLAGRNEGMGLRETLEELIEEGEEEGRDEFTPEQRALLLNALSFGQLRVDDVMVPRTDIACVPVEAGLGEVIATMREGGRTRLVVYRETLDDVVGLVHVKDLLAYWGDGEAFQLETVVRPVLVVPTSMRIIDLLLEMRDSRMHLAVVVDEFGGTDGLVTIEDLVEELVGELQQRTGSALSDMLVRVPGAIEADARVALDDLERDLDLRFVSDEERNESDTLAGLIVMLVDRVPQVGEVIEHPSGLRFTILDGDTRRIKRVRIEGWPIGARGGVDDPPGSWS
jgi:magnesium and cobalt transporter